MSLSRSELPPALDHVSDVTSQPPPDITLIKQILEHDPRPTFVFDLDEAKKSTDGFVPTPAFYNAAFTRDHSLTHILTDVLSDVRHVIDSSNHDTVDAFRLWLCATHDQDNPIDHSAAGTTQFSGQTWDRWNLGKWRIVSTVKSAVQPNPDIEISKKHQNGSSIRFMQDDWLEIPAQTPFVQWFKVFDWSSTPLGPTASWSIGFRHAVVGMLVHPRSQALVWYVASSVIIPMSICLTPTAVRRKFTYTMKPLFPSSDLDIPLLRSDMARSGLKHHQSSALCDNKSPQPRPGSCTTNIVSVCSGMITSRSESNTFLLHLDKIA